MPVGYDPIDPLRYGAARVPNNVLGIILVETTEDYETFMSRMGDCPSGLSNECGESYSGYYSLESGFQAVLTPEQQPHTFQVTPAVVGNCDTAIDECCIIDATNPIVVANPGVSPNNLFYTIAVKATKAGVEPGCQTGGCSNLDYQGIAEAICQATKAIQGSYPAFVLSAANLFVHKSCCVNNLKCLTDLAQLVTDALAVCADPAVIAGNPACSGFAQTPVGVPVTVIGLDALGNCVKGPLSAAADPCTTLKAFPVVTLPQVATHYFGVDDALNCVRVPAPVSLAKYSANHDFVALTPLVIPHNLNLAGPLAYVMEIREAIGVGGGDNFDVQVTAVTANSITLVSNTTQAGVRVTIIG